MASPTVMTTAAGELRALETVVPKKGVNTLIPALKAAGRAGHPRAPDLQDRRVTAVAPAATGTRTTTLALAAAVASGAVVALQQRVNGELKTELGDALLTALVSFGTGWSPSSPSSSAGPQHVLRSLACARCRGPSASAAWAALPWSPWAPLPPPRSVSRS
jgi:hypothetical protein